MKTSKQEQPKQYEAFLFYVDDWLSSPSVALLSLEEEGAYLNLLLRAWKQPDCGLPDDAAVLAAWSKLGPAKWRKSQARLRSLFEEQDGRLYNPRLMRERENQMQYWQERNDRHEAIRAKRAEAGKAGAEKRWNGRSDEPPLDDGKMANAIFANGKPIANAIANGMAKNSLSKSKSESFKNLSGDTGAQEHPMVPEHGLPADSPPLDDPKPRPKPAQAIANPATSSDLTESEISLGKLLMELTDQRMEPPVPDPELLKTLWKAASEQGLDLAAAARVTTDLVRRKRSTSRRWVPDSWGFFRVTLPYQFQQARAGRSA